MISALPDIKKITITDKDEFMIIACDGIWNFLTSEQAVQFVRTRLAENREKLSTICEEVFLVTLQSAVIIIVSDKYNLSIKIKVVKFCGQ